MIPSRSISSIRAEPRCICPKLNSNLALHRMALLPTHKLEPLQLSDCNPGLGCRNPDLACRTLVFYFVLPSRQPACLFLSSFSWPRPGFKILVCASSSVGDVCRRMHGLAPLTLRPTLNPKPLSSRVGAAGDHQSAGVRQPGWPRAADVCAHGRRKVGQPSRRKTILRR